MYLLLMGSNLAFLIGELSGVSQYRQEKIQKEFQMETYKSNNSLFAVRNKNYSHVTRFNQEMINKHFKMSQHFHSAFLKLIFHLWTPKNAITLHVTISTYLFVFTFRLSVNTIMIREATSIPLFKLHLGARKTHLPAFACMLYTYIKTMTFWKFRPILLGENWENCIFPF